MMLLLACLVTAAEGPVTLGVLDRLAYPGPLSGRAEPRTDLPAWLRVPRWCTTDAPPWAPGATAALIDGYAERHAGVLRLGLYWGGLAHYPSDFAPRSPHLRPDSDPLAEAVSAVRRHGMNLLAYLNPNALYEGHPLYDRACLIGEDGRPWDVAAYGRQGTRYACINHPAFAEFYRRAIAEVIERGADGIYIDGLSPHVCYCEHCRAKFRADTGLELPSGLQRLGPLAVLWEMTSDWDIVGDPQDPEHVLYSRWLAKCLTDATRWFHDAARQAKPEAVATFHTWPKPDTLPYYHATLNEIYAQRPWRYTLWKRAEFSNWGDVFSVPSLVNIYLRQEPWGGEARKVTSEVEARHLYWQALANGAYPNAWAYQGCERPFEVMARHADCFDFATTFPSRFIALPRAMFLDARHRRLAAEVHLPLRAGRTARLRILEREPNGRIDLLCLRADGGTPTDDEARAGGGKAVIYLRARDYLAERSVVADGEKRWRVVDDPAALAGAAVVSERHGRERPTMPLEYELPPLEAAGPWRLWARVQFPNVGADSFYWQVSNDGGTTWLPAEPNDDCALGWQQSDDYQWVEARAPTAGGAGPTDRFLSPAAGLFAGLLHAGLPVKELHPNHLTPATLKGFRVLVLANEVCLSDEQCEAIRQFVRQGGGLLATGETSFYDLDARRRPQPALADVLGVTVIGEVPAPAEPEPMEILDEAFGTAGRRLYGREESWLVEPTSGHVAARWPDGRPAIVTNRLGDGRVVYLPNRLDASYSVFADDGFPHLLRNCLEFLAGDTAPARLENPDQPVGVTCFEQPSRHRRLVHLVNYDAPWADSFDTLAPVENVALRLTAPTGSRIEAVREILTGMELPVTGGRVVLPRLDEYALLEVRLATP